MRTGERSLRRRWIWAAAFTVLTGCAASPLPKLAPPLPAQWRNALPPASTPADLSAWWQAFHDPQLNALVDRALEDNLDLAAARQRLLAARTLEGHEDARFLPQLDLRTDDPTDPDASAAYFLTGFDATWELGLFGRSTSVRRQSQGALNQTIAQLRMTRVSLVGELARNWLELRASQQRERLLGKVVAIRKNQLRLLRIRQRLQLAPSATVDNAEAALAQARSALIQPQTNVDACGQRLAVLLGRNEPDPRWMDPAPLPQLGAWKLTSLPADMLRSRPEIALAQAKVLSAAADAGVAHADRYPRLALGGSLIYAINTVTHKSTSENGILSFGPIVNIPLFDWGMRKARADASRHQLKAAVLDYRQAVLEGVSDVERALGTLRQQDLRERQSAVVVRAMRHRASVQRKQVALRLASPLQRADSDVALTQARLAQLDARMGRSLAYVALFKALGGAPLPRNDTHESASAGSR